MTRSEWIRVAEDRLALAGVEAPRLEAQLLAATALELERSQLLPRLGEPMANRATADQLLERRLEGEPLAYIRGVREFFGRPFHVGPGVLVPRHETETLVEVLLGAAPIGATVLDVGTGSGCIAITAKLERPDLRVAGIDVSPDALRWAIRNREELGADVDLLAGDLVAPLRDQSIHVIATNPPYIAHADPLPREIAEWEPPGALWAGEGGFACYMRLAREAPRILDKGGLLVAEVGMGQSERVRDLFEVAGWEHVGTASDLGGIPRVVTLRMP